MTHILYTKTTTNDTNSTRKRGGNMLDQYGQREVLNSYIDEFVLDYDVSRDYAKQLFLNALAYNTVKVEIINKVIDLLDKERRQQAGDDE